MNPVDTVETAKSTNPLKDLRQYGQSVWLDYIRRNLLTSGDLKKLIDDDGLMGMTSNPAIFEKAIAAGTDYNDFLASGFQIRPRCQGPLRAIGDPRHSDAADIASRLPVHQTPRRLRKPRSFPYLGHDTNGTIAEARRLWKAVDRENV
jgi:transaldolase/glucose-6-phosphate isomerase